MTSVSTYLCSRSPINAISFDKSSSAIEAERLTIAQGGTVRSFFAVNLITFILILPIKRAHSYL